MSREPKSVQWDIDPPKTKSSFSKVIIRWYELGGLLSLGVLGFTFYKLMSEGFNLQVILWFNLFSLLIHQFEEYGYPGWFPAFLNRSVFGSKDGLSYPLNPFSALVINVFLGWGIYLSAAIWGSRIPELSIVAVLISFGNVLAHSFWSIKARRWYNPGLASSLLFFLPVCISFYQVLNPIHTLSKTLFYSGLLMGVMVNALIPLCILLLANKNQNESFGYRHELPELSKIRN